MQEKIIFAKSILLVSLLVGSFFIFVSAKSSDAPDSDFIQNYNSVYSSSENQQDNSEDESFSFRVLPKDERDELVKAFLSNFKKSAPESLIENIVELTNHYDIHTVKKLMRSMAKKSKTDSLDRSSCIEKLKKAIDLL